MAGRPHQHSPHDRQRHSSHRAEFLARHSSRREPIRMNLAPLIDVTFLLLIFFVVSTTFGRPEGVLASRLPGDQGAPSVSLPITPTVVRLKQVGPGEDDFALVIDNFADSPDNFAELASFLKDLQTRPGFDAETPVVIVPDTLVAWDHVVNCFNAAVRAGCRNIAFGEGS